MTEVPHVTRHLNSGSHVDVAGAVSDAHAVKIQTFAVVAAHHSVASSIIEGLDDTGLPHESPRDPWLSTLAMASALSAASRPLFDASGRERSRAWSSVLVVSTPKTTGTRVLN